MGAGVTGMRNPRRLAVSQASAQREPLRGGHGPGSASRARQRPLPSRGSRVATEGSQDAGLRRVSAGRFFVDPATVGSQKIDVLRRRQPAAEMVFQRRERGYGVRVAARLRLIEALTPRGPLTPSTRARAHWEGVLVPLVAQ